MSDDATTPDGNSSILLIDRQVAWRDRSALALEAHGYRVRRLGNYEYPPGDAFFDSTQPSLVILGCARIGSHEQQLIERVLLASQPIVVLCSSLSEDLMRSLFLAGVKDATIKPYDSESLVALVSRTIAPFAPVAVRALGGGGSAR